MAKEYLFSAFDPVAPKAWKQKIQYDLKGADYNETLVWESPEGIKVKPFYTQEDIGELVNHPVTAMPWSAIHGLYVGNGPAAQKKAVWALGQGAEGLFMNISQTDDSLEALFQELPLDGHNLYLDFQGASLEILKKLQPILSKKTCQVFGQVDPIGHLAREGNWQQGMDKDLDLTVKGLKLGHDHLISVDATLYANAGANMTQQLAYALGHACEYLNHFDNSGTLAKFKGITFKVAIGGNYFFEIAKLRALRWLWETLANTFGTKASCHILAVPSTRNKTLYAFNVNMLRTTAECMSAIFGGADAVMNMPYDAIYHKTNDFADRLALNQLLLLKHEAHLDKVSNVADGAYYLEHLTKQLAQKALELFKQIEASGGFLKQLKAHKIQEKIKESEAKEAMRYSENSQILVGSNAFRNDKDRMRDTIQLYPFVKHKPRKTLIEPIIPRRLAEANEQERLDHE
jgi:methylmalonyl-CoA mutase